MFLASMFLIVFGAVAMDVYSASFGFVVGLFSLMGGIFLFAISLNYGPPPHAVSRAELEAEARALQAADSGSSP